MDYQTEEKKVRKLFDNCITIMVKKANDYSKESDCFSNFKKIALVCDIPVEKTFLVFIAVKIARLVELLTKDNKNESKQDSLIDIINYATLMKLYLDENNKE